MDCIVSIIIPAYNAEKSIVRTLDSIIANTVSPTVYEIIVINDGSKDETVSVVQNYIRMHVGVNLRFYSQDNKGVSAARNHGMSQANGDYLWFVDADDSISPDSLNHLIMLIDKYHCDIYKMGIHFDIGNQDVKTSSSIINENKGKIVLPYEIIHPSCGNYGHQLFLFNRRMLNENNVQYPEGVAFYEDYDFLTRALSVSKSCYINKSMVFYYYLYNPNSVSKRSRNPERWRLYINNVVEYVRNMKTLADNTRDDKLRHAIIERTNISVFSITQLYRNNEIFVSDIDNAIQRLREMGIYPINSSYISRYKVFIANNMSLNRICANVIKLFRATCKYRKVNN